MSRETSTILTNLCLIEDCSTNKVVPPIPVTRALQEMVWLCLPGGHIEEGESLAESVIREIYEETSLTIANPKLVAVKDWELDEGGRYIVFCHKSNRIHRPAKIGLKKEKFLELRWTN